LRELILAKREVQRVLNNLFAQHPDQAIFTSLPGVGAFLAPALLAKLGDDRDRFPSAATLQALAGTCPVTMASGKRKRVAFRHACDHEFRQIAQQWARCSLRKSVWAVAYWQQIRPRCASDHDAYHPWPIAGSRYSGSSGIAENLTTRLVICNSGTAGANRSRSRTQLLLLNNYR
jgi:hypothetical protein